MSSGSKSSESGSNNLYAIDPIDQMHEISKEKNSDKKINYQTLKLPSGKILRGKIRENFEIKRIKVYVLKSEIISSLN